MLHSLLPYWPVFPLVFAAGLVDAIAGGGGLISLPAYMLVGLPPHQAIGTNKLSSALGTGLSTFRFARSGYIHLQTAVFAVPFALLGSWAGARLNLLISNQVFKVLLLVILPVTAVIVLRTRALDGDHGPYGLRKTLLISCAVALGIGVYDGFYGPGTGTFLILLLTGVAHMSLQDANGLTKVINLTTNIVSLAVFLTAGQTLVPLGLAAGLCNIAGNYIGVNFFDRKGAGIVRPMMLIVLTIFLVRTVLEMIAG